MAKAIRKTTGKGGNYRPTKKGAGMTQKGIRAYRKANPKSKLKGAVTGKEKKLEQVVLRKNQPYLQRLMQV